MVQRDGTLLVLRDARGGTHSFDPLLVDSIERSVGQRRSTGKGFLIGAGIGALAGAAAGYLYEDAICGSSSCDSDPLPVMAVVNKRPHGYCMETGVDMAEIRQAVMDLVA